MPFRYRGYTPKQGDFIFVNLVSSVGREIRKRRPALVVSNSDLISRTGFAIVVPVTHSAKEGGPYIPYQGEHVEGVINTSQVVVIDCTSKRRNIQFKEKADQETLDKVTSNIVGLFKQTND